MFDMAKLTPHSALRNRAHLAAQARVPDALIWVNVVGKFRRQGQDEDAPLVSVGVPGMLDSSVVVPGGRYLEAEWKVGNDTLREDQVKRIEQLRSRGIPCRVFHAVHVDCIEAQARAFADWVEEACLEARRSY